MSLRLTVESDRTAYRPGEEVRGELEWTFATLPEKLEVRLFWYTSGKGDRDVEIANSQEFRCETAGRQSFSLRFPSAPYSFSGKLVSITWALEVVTVGVEDADVVHRDLVMGPEGREVEVHASP